MLKEEMIQRGFQQHKCLHQLPLLLQKKDYLPTVVVKDSPRERVNQQIQSARSVESRRTVNPTEQFVREPGDNEVLRYVLSDVTTTPRAQIQISQVGARFIDRETNTSEVEMRPPSETFFT